MKRKITAVILTVLMLVTSGCSQGVGSNALSENGADGGAAQEAAIVSIEKREVPLYYVVMSQEKTLPLYFVNGGEVPYVSMVDWAAVMEDLAGVYNVSESSEGVKYSMDVETDGDILTLRREDGYTMEIDITSFCALKLPPSGLHTHGKKYIITEGAYKKAIKRGNGRFITNGEYPVRDKASGGMRRDSQRKALCAANPAPSPLGADLNKTISVLRRCDGRATGRYEGADTAGAGDV